MRPLIAGSLVCVALALGAPLAWGGADEVPLRRFELQGGRAPLPALAVPQGMASLSAGECEGCHVAEAREWQGSQHRQSWTSALFQAAYRIEPMPECRNCHQPLTAGRAATPGVKMLRDEGITCAVCHVRDGSILAPQRSGRAPHAVTEAPVMAESAFCGSCHQFNFPDRRPDQRGAHRDDRRGEQLVHQTDEPMQDTLGEWQRLRSQGAMPQTCQDCHMPLTAAGAESPGGLRHRSHRFAGGYDTSTLKRAVAVAVAVQPGQGSAELRVRLAAQEAGHAVPTGDLYRSIVIEARPVDAAGKTLGAPQEQRLQRHFISTVEPDEHGRPRVQKRQSDDDRLLPGHPQELRFRLPAGAAAVHYRVSLSRLPPDAKASTATAISLIAEGQVAMSEGVSP